MALELSPLLCTFKNCTKLSKLSFDSDSFQNSLRGMLMGVVETFLAIEISIQMAKIQKYLFNFSQGPNTTPC